MKYSTATVAGFTEYHEARGRELPGTWDDAKIEAALLVASEWIDATYGSLFIGQKKDGFLQEREWPRINASVLNVQQPYTFPNDAIPERITKGVYEAAYRDAVSPGSLLVDYTPGKYKSASVHGAVSVEYAQFTFASDVQASYPIIDSLMSILMTTANQLSAYSSSTVRT